MRMIKAYLIWICISWAFLMSVAGLILPPLGVIDNSLLILIAQLLVFIASLLGLSIKNSVTKNGVTVNS